jgi:hypothetical protein
MAGFERRQQALPWRRQRGMGLHGSLALPATRIPLPECYRGLNRARERHRIAAEGRFAAMQGERHGGAPLEIQSRFRCKTPRRRNQPFRIGQWCRSVVGARHAVPLQRGSCSGIRSQYATPSRPGNSRRVSQGRGYSAPTRPSRRPPPARSRASPPPARPSATGPRAWSRRRPGGRRGASRRPATRAGRRRGTTPSLPRRRPA